MMYVFPRQFGLHNAFTSKVDFKETAHKLKDYTMREQEISVKFGQLGGNGKVSIPKRLRGATQELVQRLQVLHSRCSYSQLLQHYCPV
jgi:telomerase reverse transcriptase